MGKGWQSVDIPVKMKWPPNHLEPGFTGFSHLLALNRTKSHQLGSARRMGLAANILVRLGGTEMHLWRVSGPPKAILLSIRWLCGLNKGVIMLSKL